LSRLSSFVLRTCLDYQQILPRFCEFFNRYTLRVIEVFTILCYTVFTGSGLNSINGDLLFEEEQHLGVGSVNAGTKALQSYKNPSPHIHSDCGHQLQ